MRSSRGEEISPLFLFLLESLLKPLEGDLGCFNLEVTKARAGHQSRRKKKRRDKGDISAGKGSVKFAGRTQISQDTHTLSKSFSFKQSRTGYDGHPRSNAQSVMPRNSLDWGLCSIRGDMTTRCRLELRGTIGLPGRSTAIVDLSEKLSIMHPESWQGTYLGRFAEGSNKSFPIFSWRERKEVVSVPYTVKGAEKIDATAEPIGCLADLKSPKLWNSGKLQTGLGSKPVPGSLAVLFPCG